MGGYYMADEPDQRAQKNQIIPFYTLRGFLDAEYGVIISYGFFVFAQKTIVIRKFFNTIYDAFPDSLLKALSVFLMRADIISELMMLFMLLVVFVMMVDDYYRARVISFLAPCRSVHRFALDVFIGFAWGMALFFVPQKSTAAWLCTAIALLARATWSNLVSMESRKWEINPGEDGDRVRSHVDNWNIYQSRLTYCLNSDLSYGLLLVSLCALIITFRWMGGNHQLLTLIFFALYMFSETIRFVAEAHILYKNGEDPEGEGAPLMLKTVVPIYYLVETALLSWARVGTEDRKLN